MYEQQQADDKEDGADINDSKTENNSKPTTYPEQEPLAPTQENTLNSNQEPFNLLVRTLLTHPYVFTLTKKLKPSNVTTENVSPVSSSFSIQRINMEIDSFHVNGSEIVNDVYHVLISCFILKVLQVLLANLFNDRTLIPSVAAVTKQSSEQWIQLIKQKIGTHDDDMKSPKVDECVQYLAGYLLPFLRKCYIFLSSFGLVCFNISLLSFCLLVQNTNTNEKVDSDMEVLWTSILDDKEELAAVSAHEVPTDVTSEVIEECNNVCARLFLPTLKEFVIANFADDVKTDINDNVMKTILSVSKTWTGRYLARLTESDCALIAATYRADSIRPLLLARLPNQFDSIFKVLHLFFFMFFCLTQTYLLIFIVYSG
ncbi:hypothetical protein RFI_06171 [Reticulomyxa filosa]|uniref:E3 ubiquitin-protein ligase UBR-like C-terminal domain-containing protein n=1 Tax=Reticulomyxa filosa TaxID=46433 RepID=X6P0A6_RETFI|nr:hypothetical protein RFI_06171 [Reticulomyxa filosa]|eukprot:ETO30952.1 hypothetical protein RFI_06171 [Reticulomyxa filosa]